MRSNRIVLLIIILTLTICAPRTGAQNRKPAESSLISQKESKSPLKLTTQIIKQNYCDQPDPDMASLRLLLSLHLTNTSNSNVILSKGVRLVPHYMIAKTPEDAAARIYEQEVDIYWVTARESEPSGRIELTPFTFAVLRPGMSYETITDVSIPISRNEQVKGSIPPGQHYLQVYIWNWDESRREALRLRKKWQNSGMLWFENLVSETMAFVVTKGAKLDDCLCNSPGIKEEEAKTIANKDADASQGSLEAYDIIAFESQCEWHIIYKPRNKKEKSSGMEYILDKYTGAILHK